MAAVYDTILTTTETFLFRGGRIKVSVDTNGGALAITKVLSDASESDGDSISSGGNYTLEVSRGYYKFTPSGGCEYQLSL